MEREGGRRELEEAAKKTGSARKIPHRKKGKTKEKKGKRAKGRGILLGVLNCWSRGKNVVKKGKKKKGV